MGDQVYSGGRMVTVRVWWGPSATWPRPVEVVQNPAGWLASRATMKWGTTVRPVRLRTVTVTASRLWVWFEVRNPWTSRVSGAEVKATTATATAAASGTATAAPRNHRRAAPVLRVTVVGRVAGAATVTAATMAAGKKSTR